MQILFVCFQGSLDPLKEARKVQPGLAGPQPVWAYQDVRWRLTNWPGRGCMAAGSPAGCKLPWQRWRKCQDCFPGLLCLEPFKVCALEFHLGWPTYAKKSGRFANHMLQRQQLTAGGATYSSFLELLTSTLQGYTQRSEFHQLRIYRRNQSQAKPPQKAATVSSFGGNHCVGKNDLGGKTRPLCHELEGLQHTLKHT